MVVFMKERCKAPEMPNSEESTFSPPDIVSLKRRKKPSPQLLTSSFACRCF